MPIKLQTITQSLQIDNWAWYFTILFAFCWRQWIFNFGKKKPLNLNLNTKEKWLFFSKAKMFDMYIALLQRCKNPTRSKMELFQTTVNCRKPIPFIARHFIWNVAGFLNLPLIRLTLLLSLTIYSNKGANLESKTDLQ